MPRIRTIGTTVVALCALAGGATACGSSGSDTGPSSGGTSPSTGTTTPSTSSSKHSGAAGATFDGDYSGTIAANLCTGGIMSIDVTVSGDSTAYHGSLSASSAGFVGPDAADFTIPSGGAKPTVSGTTYSVDGVILTDVVVSKKSITLHGSLTCP